MSTGRSIFPGPKPGFHTPRGTATVGMWLFLAALFMLFAASLIGYIAIRIFPQNASSQHVVLPPLLYLSTALLLIVSFAVHKAVRAVQLEKQDSFRRWLRIMMFGAAGFIVVQTPALWVLLAQHRTVKGTGFHVYGLVFFLILVHALHVVGGIAWLIRLAGDGHRGTYDHEHYLPVKHLAMYWHFLDAVWVTMLATFLIFG